MWVIRQLATQGAVRINCGGPTYRDGGGRTWEADRCFEGGRRFPGSSIRLGSVPIDGTEDDALYLTERRFPGLIKSAAPSRDAFRGYRMPLPPGNYRVTLHFAQLAALSPAANADVAREAPPVFGVRLEGRDVLSEYKPTSRGENSAEAKGPFDISVTDGWLDIEPVRIDGGQIFAAPKFSAIEVRAAGR